MTDENIICLYWDRNEDAILETSRKYGHYCYTIAYNILYNNEDSEECVNDTYNRAWNSMPPQRPSILSAFLGKITRNISLNRYKESHAQKRTGDQFAVVLDELGEIASGTAGPEKMTEEGEFTKAVNDFLSGLPKDKRVMFVRRYWYSDDIGTIAGRLGIPENNVSVALRRIRIKLGEYLTERGFDL
ncbi:MAG: sigma-70 family RNA polymerase sigma factor [Clostridiales bacterium]|nr:sigma-70 family RNA polymerase sigma factor [Clostridiales bacterium]